MKAYDITKLTAELKSDNVSSCAIGTRNKYTTWLEKRALG